MDNIKIGYKTYEIIKTKPQSTLIEGCEILGEINHVENQIQVNAAYSEEEQKITLIHEVLHGIDELFSIELKEEQVEQLGKGLFLVLTDNNLNVVKYEIEDRL